jgi:hypothetical protein
MTRRIEPARHRNHEARRHGPDVQPFRREPHSPGFILKRSSKKTKQTNDYFKRTTSTLIVRCERDTCFKIHEFVQGM